MIPVIHIFGYAKKQQNLSHSRRFLKPLSIKIKTVNQTVASVVKFATLCASAWWPVMDYNNELISDSLALEMVNEIKGYTRLWHIVFCGGVLHASLLDHNVSLFKHIHCPISQCQCGSALRSIFFSRSMDDCWLWCDYMSVSHTLGVNAHCLMTWKG